MARRRRRRRRRKRRRRRSPGRFHRHPCDWLYHRGGQLRRGRERSLLFISSSLFNCHVFFCQFMFNEQHCIKNQYTKGIHANLFSFDALLTHARTHTHTHRQRQRKRERERERESFPPLLLSLRFFFFFFFFFFFSSSISKNKRRKYGRWFLLIFVRRV